MFAELASIIITLVLMNKFYHFIVDKPTKNVPPGLPRLPFWGSYWFLIWRNYTFPHKTMRYYAEKYKSKVISCWLGERFTVVATSYESIKELLRNKNFEGRISDAYVLKARAFGKKLGIFFIDGDQWKEQRRFALRHMREFGFGRRMDKLESSFAEELNVLLDTLKNGPINDEERKLMKEGKVLFPDILYPLAGNFFLSIFTGEPVPRAGHIRLREVSKAAGEFQRNGDPTGGAILCTPWLRHFARGFAFQGFLKGALEVTNFIEKCFTAHEVSFIEGTERGFLDTYIKKLKGSNESSTFSEEQILVLGSDFSVPSLTVNPWSVTVFIKYMMHYRNVMEKVQKEIDAVVGRDRLVTLSDRVNLPYTDATIREALRLDTIAPWGIAHRATEGDTLCGFDIPADTVLITDLYSMHHDPDFWGDPENFRPERFLTEDGRLGKDHTLLFGAGGRLCAGETFARQFLFLAFVALVQNFDFLFVEGEPSSPEDRLPGFSASPKDFWVRVTPRR